MKLNTKEWKEFRIGDWFDTVKIKGVNNDSLNKNFNNGSFRYITRTSLNNGISDMTGNIEGAQLQPQNTFSLGLLNMDFFFQSKSWYAGQFVRAIIPKFHINYKLAIYFQTVFNKKSDIYKSILVRDFDKIFLNDKVFLPSKDNEPDWDFMEEYIKEIEERYIEKVDEHNQENIQKALDAIGIAKDELDEELIIEPAKKYEEFKVGDLFEINPTKHYGLTNADLYQIDGENIVIANTSQNNGVAGYTNYENTEKGNMITFSDTTDHNSIFYQPKDFVGYSHVQGLYPLNFIEKWNKNTYLYFLTIFRKKAASKGFSYGYKFNRKLASKFKVVLPAIDKETPDFDYMEKAIYIYTKKVIKSWQLDNEKEVNALKAVINK